jgi:hypothetical protein
MNRQLTFSIYQNRFDTSSKPVTETWDYWLEELSKPHIVNDKDTFAIVLGSIPAGETHANDRVTHIDAMGLDLDGIDDTVLASVIESLEPYEYLLYTSFNHGPDATKCRVILPLKEKLDPEKFSATWWHLNRMIGGHNDPQTCNVARMFYVHSHPAERSRHATTLHHKGRWLDAGEFGEVIAPVTAQAANNPTRFLLSKELITEEGRRRVRWTGSRDRIIGAMLRSLGKGESFADKGGRENARFLLCETLAEIWPALDVERTTELFRASLTVMHEANSLKGGVEGTLSEIKYKLGRAKRKAETVVNDRETRRQSQQSRTMHSARGDGNDTMYSSEDLSRIAMMQNCLVEELGSRWMAYKDGAAYFLNLAGYQGPFGKEDARSLSPIYLSPIEGASAYNPPIGRGSRSIKSYVDLCSQYGTIITEVEASLVHDFSFYDSETGKLTEVTAKRNPKLTPTHHASVEKWLTLMGGHQAGKLLDWVAAVPKLGRQCCALYLWGAKGVGKTLLCNGLASLWGLRDITPLDVAIDSFNERLARMPLVVADEYLPDVRDISGKLRELIGSKNHTLRRKYRPEASLYGAIRLIMLANTPHLLDLKGDHTKEDLDAIAERFLFINCDKSASSYLEDLHQSEKDAMLEYKIAEHCLWLSQNWEIDEGRRFIVEGSLGEANLNISINNERTALICEWFVEYLSNPEQFQNTPRLKGLVAVEDEAIWANAYAIQKAWTLYMDGNPLTARAIGISLKTLTARGDESYKRKKVNGQQRGFYKIDTELLANWSEAHGRMSMSDIASIVGGAPF